MTLVFLTNIINHHQVPLADEFYKILGNDYHYIATQPIPKKFLDGGYPDLSNRPYLVESYRGKNNDFIKSLIDNADVLIVGGVYTDIIFDRLKANKLTFRYSERLLKRQLRLLSPIHWYRTLVNDTLWRNKNYHLLCASAFAAKDYHVYGAYPNKCYKWGYFTKVDEFDILKVLQEKGSNKVQILWCARFLPLKHPELIPKLAYELKKKGYNFEIIMLGDGVEREKIAKMVDSLNVQDCVHLLGNKPNDEVLNYMRKAHIFLFTSDRNEGWGAVLNESMSNGCAVVASDKIGSVPFLIDHGKNGLIFTSCNLNSLLYNVEFLIQNPEERKSISINAYKTMLYIWSPTVAAKRFLELSTKILLHENICFEGGPCEKINIK